MTICSYPYVNEPQNCTDSFFAQNTALVQLVLFPLGVVFGICSALFGALLIQNISNIKRLPAFLLAANLLFFTSSVTCSYVVFTGLGTIVGLDQASGRNTYFMLCMGVNFMFDGTVFSNMVIAISILPKDFVTTELKGLTIATASGLFLLIFVFVLLIYGKIAQTVSSFYRGLVVVSVVVLSCHIYHFNVILSAVIDFFGAAIPTLRHDSLGKDTILYSPSMSKHNRFVCKQIQKINRFRKRIIIAVAALVGSVLVLFTVPGLFELHVLLFSFTCFLYSVTLISLLTYFWLNLNASRQLSAPCSVDM